MEHVDDYSGALRELARITRPTGRLAVTVPTALSEKLYVRLSDEYFESPGGHIRIFSPTDTRARDAPRRLLKRFERVLPTRFTLRTGLCAISSGSLTPTRTRSSARIVGACCEQRNHRSPIAPSGC